MKTKTIDRYRASIGFDEAFKTREWINKIPFIKFPPQWEVQIIPPFSGALVRFRVNDKVSVYLDGYDLLGIVGEPYWEVYPHEDDVFRCGMNDVDALLEAIEETLHETFKTKER